MAGSAKSSPDRRGHVRFAARDLSGLRAARVKYGQEIRVIDLSAGGVYFETPGRLTPESTIVLEFSGPTSTTLVPSRVVRCESVATTVFGTRSEGACAFRRLLRLREIVTGATDADKAETADGSDSTNAWLPIVAKFRDGRLAHGFTPDFSPTRTYLHVSTAPRAEQQFVELSELDAVFFLHDSSTPPREELVARDGASYGRKVALRLPSGEEIIGSTLNYSRSTSGVFIHPLESDFGVARVFVTPTGIRHVKFL
jgi:hypothetical protein